MTSILHTPRAARYRVGNMHVVYDTGEEFWSGPVLDASESGMFVETAHELHAGQRVMLIPNVPNDDQLPFEIRAEVVRMHAYDHDIGALAACSPGLAFRFIDLSAEQGLQVREFLRDRGVPVRAKVH